MGILLQADAETVSISGGLAGDQLYDRIYSEQTEKREGTGKRG